MRVRCILTSVSCIIAAIALMGLQARADDAVSTASPPVVSVRSNGGVIRVSGSPDGFVRAAGLQKIKLSRFALDRAAISRIMLPATQGQAVFGPRRRRLRLPARQFLVPNPRGGDDGILIENPGGDMSIQVPNRVGALFINAQAGDVTLVRIRGPYVVSTADGEVRMRNVLGRGMIRTLSGNITLDRVGGDVHIQTAGGRVLALSSFAGRADVETGGGAIDWNLTGVEAGAYRFRSDEGTIRLGFGAGVAALVDAQSDGGNVQNLFQKGAADVRYSSPHALSIAINGGGPEITVVSKSGDISLEPAGPRK
ncbi:MAG: DUF4097 family beta strand repeat-containing protein [Candidatus Eremiobacter antarcticus]|nr:DUF4097 family beta strand repeat protein [Candidatus Eremiobacteraeota bacterium]MBC5808069.1 DUF4097 family beta strand repeat protein [Candidatus Eremiobacteraeota bacterium]